MHGFKETAKDPEKTSDTEQTSMEKYGLKLLSSLYDKRTMYPRKNGSKYAWKCVTCKEEQKCPKNELTWWKDQHDNIDKWY